MKITEYLVNLEKILDKNRKYDRIQCSVVFLQFAGESGMIHLFIHDK